MLLCFSCISCKYCLPIADTLRHSAFQPDHHVTHLQRTQSVCGDDTDPLAPACQHGLLHCGLAGLIQGARGLVEDEDVRFGIERAGNGDTLQLAAGEAVAALADPPVCFAATFAKKVNGGLTAGSAHLFVINLLAPVAEGHVLRHRSGKQVGILRHIADVLPVRGQLRGVHGIAVDKETTGGGLQQTAQNIDEGALARAGATHQPHGAAEGNRAANVRERVPVRTGIAVGNMVKNNVAADAEARRGRNGQHGVGGAQFFKIVQARQSRGLQAAQRHRGADHAIQGRQHAPRRERE